MAAYVVGFAISSQRRSVVLIRKNRPEWMAGLLNGVGGKIEPGEFSNVAMVREFAEETGVVSTPGDWKRLCTMTWRQPWPNSGDLTPTIDFYRWIVDKHRSVQIAKMTDEDVGWEPIESLIHREDIVPNLRWLVPLAAYTADHYRPFVVEASMVEKIG